jgi:hypothetical protein
VAGHLIQTDNILRVATGEQAREKRNYAAFLIARQRHPNPEGRQYMTLSISVLDEKVMERNPQSPTH